MPLEKVVFKMFNEKNKLSDIINLIESMMRLESFGSCSDLSGISDNNKKITEVNKMETKSRYEVIADLEGKKRQLIQERDSFEDQVKAREKEIKEQKRNLEDLEEEIKDFKESIDRRKKTIVEIISSLDESLERFQGFESQSQKK